jgi:hypothetical protein
MYGVKGGMRGVEKRERDEEREREVRNEAGSRDIETEIKEDKDRQSYGGNKVSERGECRSESRWSLRSARTARYTCSRRHNEEGVQSLERSLYSPPEVRQGYVRRIQKGIEIDRIREIE